MSRPLRITRSIAIKNGREAACIKSPGDWTDQEEKEMSYRTAIAAASAVAFSLASVAAQAAADIPVGHLATYTGPTSDVGQPYGQGIEDTIEYINKNGGINGRMIKRETVDYAYATPRAIAAYKSWTSGLKPVVILGWGTADTEALVRFVAQDQIPFISASYSGHLTDPTGKSPHIKTGAPYNFFYGPTYTDGCRAQVNWAKQDWQQKGKSGKPKFVHMGDNHPYPNAPKDGCAAYAQELGFDVLPSIVFSLKPGDFKAQCLSLKQSGANYAYLANTAGSNISVLKSCETVGVDVQFLSNVWGFDQAAAPAAGKAGDGVLFPGSVPLWNEDMPGMKTVREVSKISDPSGQQERTLHYVRGVCSVFLMRDAMQAAAKSGEITGPSVKAALEQMKEHVPGGLEGVCLPHTFTAENHQGTTSVVIYRSKWNDGNPSLENLSTVVLPRRDDWLGW